MNSPPIADVFKLKVTLIFEDIIFDFDGLVHFNKFLESLLQHFTRRMILVPVILYEVCELTSCIAIKDITPVAVCNKNVAVAIVVKIRQKAGPAPFRFSHP